MKKCPPRLPAAWAAWAAWASRSWAPLPMISEKACVIKGACLFFMRLCGLSETSRPQAMRLSRPAQNPFCAKQTPKIKIHISGDCSNLIQQTHAITPECVRFAHVGSPNFVRHGSLNFEIIQISAALSYFYSAKSKNARRTSEHFRIFLLKAAIRR